MSIPCQVTFKKARAVYFKLKPDGVLYVTSPIKYKATIESIILTKSTWIKHHFRLLNEKRRMMTDSTVYFLGKQLNLKHFQITKGKQQIVISEVSITLHLKNLATKKAYLDQTLKNATKEYIQSILPNWILKTGLTPASWNVRKMKKWGSCTKGGKIIFNAYLICLPEVLIEYIVCHELTHLLHFDHSKNFHHCVADFIPNVKKLEKELKMYVR